MPHCAEMAQLLIDAGAPIDEPLIAAASIDNIEAIPILLKSGAAINGNGKWSPIEDALTFSSHRAVKLLLEQGASIHNLRIAAGVGRLDLIEGFFDAEGRLKPEAGKLAWPFRDPDGGWSQDPPDIIDNAFVYACMSGRIDAAECLLNHGADQRDPARLRLRRDGAALCGIQWPPALGGIPLGAWRRSAHQRQEG